MRLSAAGRDSFPVRECEAARARRGALVAPSRCGRSAPRRAVGVAITESVRTVRGSFRIATLIGRVACPTFCHVAVGFRVREMAGSGAERPLPEGAIKAPLLAPAAACTASLWPRIISRPLPPGCGQSWCKNGRRVLEASRRRWRLAEVLIAPCAVQSKLLARARMTTASASLHRHGPPDFLALISLPSGTCPADHPAQAPQPIHP